MATERDTLLVQGEGDGTAPHSRPKRWTQDLAAFLESPVMHWGIILLTALDASFVLTDIGYEFLKDPRCLCDDSCPEDPVFLEWFAFLSLSITTIFLAEIPADLLAFGWRYYLAGTHAWLHAFDAVVIASTWILELFLRGREAEIAGLLVLLRLWRLIKLVSTVSVGVSEYDELAVEDREQDGREEWEREKMALRRKIERLKVELGEVRRRAGVL